VLYAEGLAQIRARRCERQSIADAIARVRNFNLTAYYICEHGGPKEMLEVFAAEAVER
jgi:hypothetical protein